MSRRNQRIPNMQRNREQEEKQHLLAFEAHRSKIRRTISLYDNVQLMLSSIGDADLITNENAKLLQVIRAENVAELSTKMPFDEWVKYLDPDNWASEVPIFRPPFENMFIEHHYPQYDDPVMAKAMSNFHIVSEGVYLNTYEDTPYERGYCSECVGFLGYADGSVRVLPMVWRVFTDREKGIVTSIEQYKFPNTRVKGNYETIYWEPGNIPFAKEPAYPKNPQRFHSIDFEYHDLHEPPNFYMTEAMAVVALTISLMHCRNVEQIEEQPQPKLVKQFKRQFNRPLNTYKTLKVNSMQKQSGGDPADSSTAIKGLHRLHIARGHFKDYRDGPGLFGKFNEIYWWDQHVRGNAKRGIVVKDYDVQAPTD